MTRKQPKAKTTPKKSETKRSAKNMSVSGTTQVSETANIDIFRKPKPRKGRKGTKYFMYYWFEQQMLRLPKSKFKKDLKEWLDDPENGLTW
jgi:hypothetical protein